MPGIGVSIYKYIRRYFSGGITPIPNPPYIIFSRNLITGLHYNEGEGPSNESVLFSMSGLGLPADGTATVTPPTDFEMYDPTLMVWTSAPFTYDYTGTAFNTGNIFKVRLKSGLPILSYNENFLLQAATAPDFILNVRGFVSVNNNVITAQGGNIYRDPSDSNYIIHEFLEGEDSFSVLSNPSGALLEYELIAGGGSGAAGGNIANGNAVGGGAAGEIKTGTFAPVVQSYYVKVGLGGPRVESTGNYGNRGMPGEDSQFDTITSLGGGEGATNFVGQPLPDITGGDPGGGGGPDGPGGASSGIVLQGGTGNGTTTFRGGGGGGVGSAGKDGDDATEPGYGGLGITSTIKGDKVCAGGGGAAYNTTPKALGGDSVGGDSGGGADLNGSDAVENSGSGGGAGIWAGLGGLPGNSGKGANGRLLIRYFHPGSITTFMYTLILENGS